MTNDLSRQTMVSELISRAVMALDGRVGAIVRDVPNPDPDTLIKALASTGLKLHVSYLLKNWSSGHSGITDRLSNFATDVEAAERWRNQRDLEGLIVVVAQGDEPKLSSLEEFDSISSRNLKTELVRVAQETFEAINDVQGSWWAVLGADAGFALPELMDYFLSVMSVPNTSFKAATVNGLPRLGLLQDPDFFNDPSISGLRRRVERHRDTRSRLRALNPADRDLIKIAINSESDAVRTQQLRTALHTLMESRWSKEGTLNVSLSAAEQLLTARTSARQRPGGHAKRTVISASRQAAISLVTPDDSVSFGSVSSGVTKEIAA